MTYQEHHRSHRSGWLRASVLGANDGIVSTASLIIGVAAANASQEQILIAGIAGLVAGAMSMAAGEYVSVSSQSDTEKADLRLEAQSLEEDERQETAELAEIYRNRGLDAELAEKVAVSLMAHDPLGAHARDEIGITDTQAAKPLQAAWSSAAAFTIGAALPLAAAWLTTGGNQIPVVASRIVDLPGSPWRHRGTRWWRTHSGRRNAGHLLGRIGDVPHSHRWSTIRGWNLTRPSGRFWPLAASRLLNY